MTFLITKEHSPGGSTVDSPPHASTSCNLAAMKLMSFSFGCLFAVLFSLVGIFSASRRCGRRCCIRVLCDRRERRRRYQPAVRHAARKTWNGGRNRLFAKVD